MTDEYAEAREVIRKADEHARSVKLELVGSWHDGQLVRRWLRSAFIAGYTECTRDVAEMAAKITRGAGVGEVPAAYDCGFRISQDNPTASPPPEGLVHIGPDAMEVLRAVRPSREAVGFLVKLTREALDAGKTDDAAETLALALCMRALARG